MEVILQNKTFRRKIATALKKVVWKYHRVPDWKNQEKIINYTYDTGIFTYKEMDWIRII